MQVDIKSEYGQEMPQSHTAGQPTTPRGKVKEQYKPHDLCDLQDGTILTTELQLGRVPLGDATYQIQNFMPFVI